MKRIAKLILLCPLIFLAGCNSKSKNSSNRKQVSFDEFKFKAQTVEHDVYYKSARVDLNISASMGGQGSESINGYVLFLYDDGFSATGSNITESTGLDDDVLDDIMNTRVYQYETEDLFSEYSTASLGLDTDLISNPKIAYYVSDTGFSMSFSVDINAEDDGWRFAGNLTTSIGWNEYGFLTGFRVNARIVQNGFGQKIVSSMNGSGTVTYFN